MKEGTSFGHRRFKKKLTWRATVGAVEICVQVFREGRRGNRLRPFCEKAGVNPGGWSRLLERALTDFGAEESFSRAAQRVKEQYGIEVSASAIRVVTYNLARKIEEVERARRPVANTLLSVVAGSMLPLMKSGPH